jgi:hypothetical protein
MNLINKNESNFEFEIRNIGGSDVFYKHKIGDDKSQFSTKKDFEKKYNYYE